MKKLLTLAFAAAFAVAGTASAATVEELQAQIDALLAQLSGISTTTTTGYTFNNDLTIGSEGADVVALQSFLESKGTLVIPAGVSKGYFGALTQSALASYQAMVGISPAAGYFGPITRANVNAASSVVVGTTTTTGSTGLSGDEASLEDFNMKDGDDDDVQEGGTAEVAVIEFDVEDGDVEIKRLDLTFEFAGTTGEDDAWDAFDTVTLLVDGDEIASEDVSDEDDWLVDDDPFVFRFSGLNYVVNEGDQAEITVEVEAQNGVDDADTSGANDWTIYIDTDDIRALDGAGVDQYTGDSSETVTFGIEEEGEDEELTVTESDDNPESTTIQVEDDETSEWATILVFEMEAEENDIEIKEIPVTFATGTADIADVINDFMIVIDGEEYDDFDTDGSLASTTEVITFDLDDEDVVVDEGDTVEVEVMVELKATTGNYANGETVMAELTSSNVDAIDAEGADDLDASQLDGSAVGETHDLYDSGLRVEFVSETVTPSSSDEARASYKITVDVTSFEGDFFIEKEAGVSTDAAGDDFGFAFEVETPADVAYAGYGSVSSSVSAATNKAGDTGSFIKVSENQTRTITLLVTVDNDTDGPGATASTGTEGYYQVQLNEVGYASTAVAATDAVSSDVLEDFETEEEYLEADDIV